MKTIHYITMANEDTLGHSKGTRTERVKAGIYKAGQLVGFDADNDYSVLASSANLPYGIVKQDITALDDKTYACIIPIANSGQTVRLLIADNVKKGEMISFDKNGLSKKCADGNNIIGIALTSGQKGDLIEAITCIPQNLK